MTRSSDAIYFAARRLKKKAKKQCSWCSRPRYRDLSLCRICSTKHRVTSRDARRGAKRSNPKRKEGT